MAEFMARYSLREQLIVGFAALVLLVIGVHALLIEPYQNRVSSLHDELSQSKADLQWMTSMIGRIPASGNQAVTQNFDGSLANLVDRTVKRQKINTYLSQMTPKGEEEIRLRFSAVPFSQLVQFIANMNDLGLTVKDLRINASDKPAQVDSNLVFTKS